MKLSIEYTGQLRTAFGRSVDPIELPEGATVAVLLERLGEQGGEGIRPHLLTADGRIQPSLLIAVNGAAHPARQAATTVLRDGDQVVLLPPIAGG